MGKRTRNLPKEPKTTRPLATRELKTHFYVFCEGQNTEPNYLKR